MIVTFWKPNRASCRRTTSRIGIGSASPSGISGLGKTWVNGRSLVPFPPARTMACIAGPSSVLPVHSPRRGGAFSPGLRDFLAQCDEPADVAIERLFPPQSDGLRRHRPARLVVRELVQGVGQFAVSVGRRDDEALAPRRDDLPRAVAAG